VTEPDRERGRGHVKAFVIGLVAGAALMFFFSGIVIKFALLGVLVVVAIVLARVL